MMDDDKTRPKATAAASLEKSPNNMSIKKVAADEDDQSLYSLAIYKNRNLLMTPENALNDHYCYSTIIPKSCESYCSIFGDSKSKAINKARTEEGVSGKE